MDFIKGYTDITEDWLFTVRKGIYSELKKGEYFNYNNKSYLIDEKNVTTYGMEEEKRFAKHTRLLYKWQRKIRFKNNKRGIKENI